MEGFAALLFEAIPAGYSSSERGWAILSPVNLGLLSSSSPVPFFPSFEDLLLGQQLDSQRGEGE